MTAGSLNDYQPSSLIDPRPTYSPRGERAYGHVSFLYWFTRESTFPTLFVADGNSTNEILASQERQGLKASLGMWIDPDQQWAIEVGGFFLGDQEYDQGIRGARITRPYFDVVAAAPAELIVSDRANNIQGSASISGSQSLWGTEANLRHETCRWAWGHFDLLAGGRFLRLAESANITTDTQFPTFPNQLSNARVQTFDSFATQNRFYGGQVGLETEIVWGRVYFDAFGKVALGNLQQEADIEGRTIITAPPQPLGNQNLPGGFLALPSNSGEFTRNRFTTPVEVGGQVGYRITDHFRLGLGYQFLFLPTVLRPGQAMDIGLNPTQVPQLLQGPATGPLRPTVQWENASFWAQGINIDLEFRF